MTAPEKLAIARKLSLLLDGEEAGKPEDRAELLLLAARAEVDQSYLIGLVSAERSFK